MGKWGNCDFKQLQDLQKRMNKLQAKEIFYEACAKELAARLLARVMKLTPTGDYPLKTGKKGGTLKRGWTAKSEREAELTAVFGGGDGAKKYVDSLKVTKSGDTYEIEIINPVNYASYVEYGHRTRNHEGWKEGRFMLTISEQEIDAKASGILERKLKKFMEEMFNGE